MRRLIQRLLDVGERYFALNIIIMRYTGMWPETRADAVRSTILLTVMLFYIALQIPALNSEDMSDVTEVGSIIVNDCVIVFKLFHIRIYYKRYDSMMKGMKEFCTQYGREFPYFKPFLQKSERQLRVITMVLITFVGSVCFTWAALPAIRPGMYLNVPIKMWLPFDTSEGIGFWTAYAFCFGLLSILTPVYVLLHTLYIGLIVMICGQLKLLSSLLSSITHEEREVQKKLKSCIDMHNEILRYGKELENLMNPIMLAQFGGSMSVLCQTGIQITMNPLSNERTIKFLVYIIMVLTDIWIYSYYGNQLLQYSTRIHDDAYSCPWYELENTYQKSFCLVILRAQHPVKLTIGKLYTISLTTFSDAVKFSYTVFTILSQVHDSTT